MAIYAVGDIQGCYSSFRQLLDACSFDAAHDRLWLVGDLVNRGPESLAVLRYVRSLGQAATVVLGNHDIYLLLRAAGLRRVGKGDTLQPVLDAPDCDELLHWLAAQPLCHLENGFCLVHAGILPGWSFAEALTRAAAVSDALQNDRDFLPHIWGDDVYEGEHDDPWQALRFTVNVMSRMRFLCRDSLHLELKTKGEPQQAPAELLPWFEAPRKDNSATLLCGHWSALGLRLSPQFIALDSGCLWGRQLSAVRLHDRCVFQVPCAEKAG